MYTDRERGGFVLLEAVVALAIVGVVVIALLETTATQFRTATKATHLVVARSLAEDRLSALRLLDHEDFSDLPDSLADGTFAAPYEDFTWTVSVEEFEEEYDLFEAEIAVSGYGEVFLLRTLVHAARPVLQADAQGGGGTGVGGRGQGGDGGRGGGDG